MCGNVLSVSRSTSVSCFAFRKYRFRISAQVPYVLLIHFAFSHGSSRSILGWYLQIGYDIFSSVMPSCTCLCVRIVYCATLADPRGRAGKGVGLRPLACWDCGFEFRQRHGCVSRVSCAVRYRSTSGWSLVHRSLTNYDVPSVVMKPR